MTKRMVDRGRLGFFAALCVLLGSVVGVGIFFKNISVGRGVDQEKLAWMLAWIIGGFIVLFTAIAFCEVGRLGSSKISGLGLWASLVGGKRFGHFVTIGFAILYLAIDTVAISFIVSEVFFNMLGAKFSNFSPASVLAINLMMGLVFTLSILAFKRLSIRGSGYIQVVTTCIKFLPLIAAAFVGIFVASFGQTGTVESASVAASEVFDPTTRMLKIFGVMPAVLFAYDSFLNVASMSGRIRRGEKRIPLILFLGLTIVIALYTLIGLASALTKSTTVGEMFAKVTSDKTAGYYLGKFVDVTIFVSAFGVLNGITMVFDSTTSDLCDIGIFYGSERAKKRFGKKASLFYVLSLLAFFFIFFALVSIPFGTDVFIDGISSYTSIVFFIVYCSVIALYAIKRKRFQVAKLNSTLFYASAILSVLGLSVSMVFFTIKLVKDIVESDVSTLGWGILFDYGYKFRPFLPLLLLFLYLFFLFLIHIGNAYLVKREGRDVFAIIESQKPILIQIKEAPK